MLSMAVVLKLVASFIFFCGLNTLAKTNYLAADVHLIPTNSVSLLQILSNLEDRDKICKFKFSIILKFSV